MESNSGANPNQQQAIETIIGALLIIAGPGSGKTFTLVERIVHLITKHGVKPENLLIVTFTNKAAQELVTRISNRLTELNIKFNLNEMYLGTFHSICLRWLEEYREFTRLKRSFILMDEFDQHYFVYRKIAEYRAIDNINLVLGEGKSSTWDKVAELIKRLNGINEEAIEIDTLLGAEDEAICVVGKCCELYQQQLNEENALDFSTIQYEAYKLLKDRPEILNELREKISYLMVDEYQDTNSIQEKIILLLAGENANLCVVGDDDQGLYRFRGATIRNILEFKQNFSENSCQQISLTVNYRSHPDIINFYNRWMSGQIWDVDDKSFRFTKKIVPRESTFPEIPSVIRVSAFDNEDWHNEILCFLNHLKEKGQLTDWNQVAFLFKSVKNDKVTALARFLERNGMVVYSPRSSQFFEREEIRLMIGAFIALFPQFPEVRQWDSNITLSIWDYYDFECFKLLSEKLRLPENRDIKNWIATKRKMHQVLSGNANYGFTDMFYQLLQFPLFSGYLNEDRIKEIQNSRPMRNLAIFSQLMNKFEYLHHISVLTPKFLDSNLRSLFNQFFRFLKDGGINEYEDTEEYAPSGCVSFLTIHQSKGLEFPIVIVGSLGASPRKQYTDLDEILQNNYFSKPPFEPLEHTKFFDFRRLYYTAFSRAQNLLVLTCQEVKGQGRTPSKYFEEYFYSVPDWRDEAFKVEGLPLESVKEVNLKKEYSFTSHLTLFENCAEQYRFFKELAFTPVRKNPILFGNLVHQTLEDIHKTVLQGKESQLSESKINDFFELNYFYLSKRERVYLTPIVQNLALQHVLRYYRRHEHDWSRIREAEVDVSLVKDDYILKGSIDLVSGQGNSVEIIDFKSEKKLDVNAPKDKVKLDRYRRQLEVYAHIVEQRLGLEVTKTHLYYTGEESGNPYISWDKNKGSIEATINTFDDTVKRIECKDFRIAERPEKLCSDCDIRFYCDRKNWNFSENV
ncbi:MAG: AAA family ATPase [Actinobacteria bacterium]|nr:AAA family ATPase [Actinomycetota bacterium]